MRDAGDVEDGILLFHGVKAGVVAEGTFGAQLVELDVPFEDDFGVRRNFEVHGLALHQLDRLLTQESGDDELFDLGRCWDDGRKRCCGIGADGDGYFEAVVFQIAERNLGCASRGFGHGVHVLGRCRS